MQLERRSQRVLQLVIETYIHTAKGVSSQALAEQVAGGAQICPNGSRRASGGLRGLSSATLRASLAELEAVGLLVRPHPSAGRVPTEAGLRLYVDTLLAPRLRPWDRSRLDATKARNAPEAYAAFLGRKLAALTGHVAMVATPSFLGSRVREVGLVALGGSRVLAYFVAPAGHVQQKVVDIRRVVTAPELVAIQNLLNEMLADRSLQQMRQALEQELGQACNQHDRLRRQAVAVGHKLWPQPGWQVVVEGTAELLLQPEFADRNRLHELLQAIEQKTLMLTLVDEMLAHPGVLVRLGSEHARADLPQVAYVGCGSSAKFADRAAVGLFGPSRMDYGRLVPLVQYAAGLLARFYAEL